MKKASLTLALAALAGLPAQAASVEITVKDAKGGTVQDAVVWAMPKAGPAPFRRRDAAIGQKDKTFLPFVSVVQTGTTVQFPNQDPIRHHIYSFSPPKPFEIKLYAGTPVPPTIVFDKPGEVVLGCNIHDHMLAFVYVVDSPWFAKTGSTGQAHIEGLPAGDYELKLWHPAQAAPVAAQPLKAREEETVNAGFSLELRPLPPRTPSS